MKKRKILFSLLFPGSFFLCCALCCGFASGRVKKGVTANGLAVGGLRIYEAVRLVREQLKEELLPLTLSSPAGEVTVRYPELSFTDDAEPVLRRARRGQSVLVTARRQWAEAESFVQALCEKNARAAEDARVEFSACGFTYERERAGLACDYQETLARVTDALERGEERVELVTREYPPAVGVQELYERTQRLSSFTTRFDAKNLNRVHNIRRAAEKLTGSVIPPHGEFSFNARVGRRTEENGFKESVVIRDGEFVKGVGGGVCQLSTTLFNAALRAGLLIKESRNHSLAVSYVAPSLDAMVSSYSDLRFVNPYDTPVYLSARVGEDSVTAEFYGLPDGFTYRTESVVLYRLAPPPEQVVEGEEEKLVRAPKEGIASESYLLKFDGMGKLCSRTLLRRDSYAVVQGIRQVKKPSYKAPQEDLSEESSPLPPGVP